MANPFRTAARLQSYDRRASFAGAEHTRLMGDWSVANLHPDWETRWALRELRARARDLVRNNPYATGVVEAFADNICGWEGIQCKPRILGPDGKPARLIRWEIERGWHDWGCEHASVDGQDSWFELERLIIRSWVQDGEVFIRRRKGWDNPYGYAVQILDPDMLDESFNRRADANGNEIRMGVELDKNGRRVAYHFFKYHPSEGMGSERVPIPASEITHFFVRYRAGQTRGFSLFAPVLTTMKHVDGYTEAELVAARAEASKMGFIKNMTPEAITAYAERLRIQAAQGKDAPARKMRVAPLQLEELMPGQEFQEFDPSHPNTSFDPFVKVLLRGAARGFSISYLTFTGDVSAANYSSMRAGLIPERDHWKVLQVVASGKVHRPCYRDLIGTGLLTGAFRLPTPIATDYYAVDWRGRRWQWVDPLNDLEAAEMEVHLGVNSRQRIAADRGLDFETVIDESKEDQEYAEEAGVWIGGAGGTERIKVDSEPPAQNGNGKRKRRGREESENGNGNGSGQAHRLVPYFDGARDGD